MPIRILLLQNLIVGVWAFGLSGFATASQPLDFANPTQITLNDGQGNEEFETAPIAAPGNQILFATSQGETWDSTYKLYLYDYGGHLRREIKVPKDKLLARRLLVLQDGGFALPLSESTPGSKGPLLFLNRDGSVRAKTQDLRYDRYVFKQLRNGNVIFSTEEWFREYELLYFSPEGRLLKKIRLPHKPEAPPLELADGTLFMITEDRKVMLVHSDGRSEVKAQLPPVPNPLPKGIYFGSAQPPTQLANGNIVFSDYNYEAELYTVFLFRPTGEDTGNRFESVPIANGFAFEIVPLADGSFAQMSYQYRTDNTSEVIATVLTVFNPDLSVRRRIRLPGVEGTQLLLLKDGVLAIGDSRSMAVVYVTADGEAVGRFALAAYDRIRDPYRQGFRMIELNDGRIAFRVLNRLTILKRDERPYQFYLRGRLLGQPQQVRKDLLAISALTGPADHTTGLIYLLDSKNREVLQEIEVTDGTPLGSPFTWTRADGTELILVPFLRNGGGSELLEIRLDGAIQSHPMDGLAIGPPWVFATGTARRLVVPTSIGIGAEARVHLSVYEDTQGSFVLKSAVPTECLTSAWPLASGQNGGRLVISCIAVNEQTKLLSFRLDGDRLEPAARIDLGRERTRRILPIQSDLWAVASAHGPLRILDSGLVAKSASLAGWGTTLVEWQGKQGFGICPAASPADSNDAEHLICLVGSDGKITRTQSRYPIPEKGFDEFSDDEILRDQVRAVGLSSGKWLVATASNVYVYDANGKDLGAAAYKPGPDFMSSLGGYLVTIDPIELGDGAVLLGGQTVDRWNHDYGIFGLSFLTPVIRP